MMSIVAALLGVAFCVTPLESYHVALGVAMLVCGVAMVAMFALVARQPSLAIPVLVLASVTAILGIAAVVVYRNPFSWMAAMVGMAILIDAVCLKINLARE